MEKNSYERAVYESEDDRSQCLENDGKIIQVVRVKHNLLHHWYIQIF